MNTGEITGVVAKAYEQDTVKSGGRRYRCPIVHIASRLASENVCGILALRSSSLIKKKTFEVSPLPSGFVCPPLRWGFIVHLNVTLLVRYAICSGIYPDY